MGISDIDKDEKQRSNISHLSDIPLVSVIITTRNESDTIRDCIISILEQTYLNFEVILIDAKSSDGTFERAVDLENLSGSFKNCKRYLFMSEEANSPARGRNLGAKAAYGTILAFTDGDCVVEKDWLMSLIKYIPPEMGIVGGPNILRHYTSSKILDAIDNVLGTYLGSGGSPQFLRIKDVSEVYAVPSCNMAIQKGLFYAVGGFDERLRYNEDSDLCNRIHEQGYRIIFTPQAKVNHFMGMDSFCNFSSFIYKYGLERGKNLAHNAKLFTKFNVLSSAFLLAFVSLVVLSFFYTIGLTMLLMFISSTILIPIFFSIRIAIHNKRPTLALLALPTYILLFTFYNIGLFLGYVQSKY